MIRTKSFDMFGVKYRSRQFCATIAMDMLSIKTEIAPTSMLAQTEVDFKGTWLPLDNEPNINLAVEDVIGQVAPVMVLRALVGIVHDFNFSFLDVWKGNKVPERFLSNARVVEAKSSTPLIFQLIQDGSASLRELEEYYSLEDAFKMFDIAVTKGINTALANEAATKK